MPQETPEHRSSFKQRSGDTHVIGTPEGIPDHAEAVNVDQQAREHAAANAAAEAAASAARPDKRTPKPPLDLTDPAPGPAAAGGDSAGEAGA